MYIFVISLLFLVAYSLEFIAIFLSSFLISFYSGTYSYIHSWGLFFAIKINLEILSGENMLVQCVV